MLERIVRPLMDGWYFAMGEQLPQQDAFHAVDLPHDWAVEAPFSRTMPQAGAQGYRNRFGVLWYRNKFLLDAKMEGYRYYLDFGGVYECSTVWVNGVQVGENLYGYTPFRVEITDAIQPGENTLLVKADNSQIPADRWLSPAGIYRRVRWMALPQRHLDPQQIRVQTHLKGNTAAVTVDGGEAGELLGMLQGEDVQLQQRSGEDGKLHFVVEHPKLWSAQTPYRYTLTLTLLQDAQPMDQISMQIGLREIVFDSEQGMLVNGEKVKLKGVCIHQDFAPLGNAFHPELWRERLEDLKEAGCNALRLAHHLFAEEFLDLCDEMGFYVYEECFDKWQSGLYGRYFDTQWRKDLSAMVLRDRNRPSVVIWGLGNEVENQGQPSMIRLLRMLREYLLTLDDTRPVSVALNPHFKRESGVDARRVADIQQFVDEVSDTEIYDVEERMQRVAEIARWVDILCCNYQEPWYQQMHLRFPDKLILGTEIYQYFMGRRDQMKNFDCSVPALVPFYYDYVIGGFIWTGFDYLGESVGYPSKGWGGSLIRTPGDRRPSYYMMQSYWSDDPMVHFSVLDTSLPDEGVKEMWDIPMYADHWDFPQIHKAVIPYVISSNCEQVELYLNGTRYYLPEPKSCPNRLIAGFLPYQSGRVEVVGICGGKEVCRQVTVTPGPVAGFAFETPLRKAPAEKGYTLLLRVHAVDQQGNRCFHPRIRVCFRVEGPGRLAAVDNGELMGEERYDQNSIPLYRGCATVLVRLDGTPGSIKVFAESGTSVSPAMAQIQVFS